MKRSFLFISAFLLLSALYAQKPQLHSPAEILKIMTDSKMHYLVGQLENKVKPRDQSMNLNFNNVYRVSTADGVESRLYSISPELKKMVDKAEEAFGKDNTGDARKFYLKALDIDPKYYTIMTYVGQTYGIEKDWDKAIEWYEKTIKLNYIDYMAHWFLADAYHDVGRIEEAKKEILIAHVLNRNNPRILSSLKRILRSNKLAWKDWVFNPQYTILQKTNDSIDIKYGEGWLAYAMTKAIWAYEPGYSKSMGYDNDNFFRELEEKEALIGLLLSDDPETKALPETLALQKATEDDDNTMLQEFVFYEILLRDHPAAAYQFPDGLITAITDYLLSVRCEKSN
jgi:tetratricopeptide (TPR) repeat protein